MIPLICRDMKWTFLSCGNQNEVNFNDLGLTVIFWKSNAARWVGHLELFQIVWRYTWWLNTSYCHNCVSNECLMDSYLQKPGPIAINMLLLQCMEAFLNFFAFQLEGLGWFVRPKKLVLCTLILKVSYALLSHISRTLNF